MMDRIRLEGQGSEIKDQGCRRRNRDADPRILDQKQGQWARIRDAGPQPELMGPE